jgi:Mg-chelatase subunit ChlD
MQTKTVRGGALWGALSVIVGFITGTTGIQVVRGSRPRTTGKTIFLPQLPDLQLAWDEVTKVIAYIYHEAAHILWSDFSITFTSALQKAMVGTLEDIRIENKAIHSFPAARKYLGELVRLFAEAGLSGKGLCFPMVDDEMSESEVLQWYILYKLRHDLLRQTGIAPVLATAVAAAERKFSAGMLVKLNALMFQVERCDSTSEVLDLSDEIIKMIKEEKEKEEEEEQKQQQNQQKQQQQPGTGESDEDSDGSGCAQNDGSESEPAEGSDGEQGNPSVADPDDGNNQGDGATDSSSKNGAGGQSKTLEKLLDMSEEDIIQSIDSMLEEAVQSVADQKSGRGTSLPNLYRLPLKEGGADMGSARGSINAIRTRTLNWMSSAAQSEVQHSRTGIAIDTSCLHAVPTGGLIFAEESEGIDLNAAISIVIDRSGSMGALLKDACTAALSAMLAFDVPGIATQVSVFPVYGDNGSDCDDDEGVAVVKHWGETPRALAKRIGSMSVDGGTPMAEAILHAGACILPRRETLRLVMVVTDGDPNELSATQDVIEALRKSGISVVGLGIGVDPSRVFGSRYSATLSSTTELAGNMVKLVRAAMSNR